MLGARSDFFPAGISHLLLCLADAYSLFLYINFSLPTWKSIEKEFPCGGVSCSSNPALKKQGLSNSGLNIAIALGCRINNCTSIMSPKAHCALSCGQVEAIAQ